MPRAVLVLNSNLIAEQHFCAAPFPTSIAGAGKHEAAGWVDVDGRDDAATVAGDDGERDGAVAGGLGLCDVVDAEDVV